MAIRIVGKNIKKNDLTLLPSRKDKELTRKLKVKRSNGARQVDFKKHVVNKPWGFEYLCYRNRHHDIWEFHLNPSASTSLHCHPGKSALKITLEGEIEFETVAGKEVLIAGNIRIIKGGVVHRTLNSGGEIARVLEIESPPDKENLIRINDSYGRQDSPYVFSAPSLNMSSAKARVNSLLKGNGRKISPGVELFPLFSENPSHPKNSKATAVTGLRINETSPNHPCKKKALLKIISKLKTDFFVLLNGTLAIEDSSGIRKIHPGSCCFVRNLKNIHGPSKKAELLLIKKVNK